MIPDEKMAAVRRGLREAFGVEAFDEIRIMTKGQTSALVFRIAVKGKPYLLRIMMRRDDPTRHFACMRAAAGVGLAPRVWYTSVEDRLSITDYVDAVLLSATKARLRMPAVLRSVHALPPFAGVERHMNTTCMFLMHEGAAREGFLRRFQEARILPEAECEEFFALYAQLAAVSPRDGWEMVSSHNDLFKPDNVLFDGERVWLVDWEAAFLNDRYADLAVVANLVVGNEAEERAFLEAYFGQPSDTYQMARFFLMRQLTHVFYGMIYLMQSCAGEPWDAGRRVPGFAEFQRRFWAGEVRLEDKETKAVYGRVHVERLFENARSARWDESLRIVGDALERSGGWVTADSLRE